jgi:7-cyano-7-deazaguanine tRNA-ribosyltransferase
MTENGTWRLSELDYFPCQCPKCSAETPRKVLEKPVKEQETFLAEHNLHVCQGELKRIKQAIRDGRLWEHLEMRAHAHPALLTALRKLQNHEDFVEKHSPTVKKSGLFFFDSHSLSRPEVVHYQKRFSERYSPPENAKVLLFVPQTSTKPFHKAREFQNISQVLKRLKALSKAVHSCVYAAPFGVTPLELDEVYPLSQHETALPLEKETIEHVARQAANHIIRSHYETVVLLHDPEKWSDKVSKACKKACQTKGIKFEQVKLTAKPTKDILTRLEDILRNNLSE